MARLSALIAPPRYPLTRYHGVLAPHSPHRAKVVPRPPAHGCRCAASPTRVRRATADAGESQAASGKAVGAAARGAEGVERDPCAHRDGGEPETGARALDANDASSATLGTQGAVPGAPSLQPQPDQREQHGAGGVPPAALRAAEVEQIAPNIISVRHWNRLLGGLLLATSPRVDWHTLLRRTYGTDIFECPKCHHGRLRIGGAVTDQAAARRILEHLGRATTQTARPDPIAKAGSDGARRPATGRAPAQPRLPGIT